jgi:hypothetical protein
LLFIRFYSILNYRENKEGAMHNVDKRKVSITTVIAYCAKDEYFRKGYDSAWKNQAFDYDIYSTRNAILYARGRSFAIFCKLFNKPRAVWRNNVLAKTAQERLSNCF